MSLRATERSEAIFFLRLLRRRPLLLAMTWLCYPSDNSPVTKKIRIFLDNKINYGKICISVYPNSSLMRSSASPWGIDVSSLLEARQYILRAKQCGCSSMVEH